MLRSRILISISLFLVSCAYGERYPEEWWWAVNADEQKSWEITPDSVKPPQVILSKRNELGWLSNFADTPFQLDGKTYASMEGFWQATKYPEGKKDPRSKWTGWKHSRPEVEKMVAFAAKKAGRVGSQLMKQNDYPWVTYQGHKMLYKELKQGAFYQLIVRAMTAKLEQNPKVQSVLCSTEGLELLPDHKQGPKPPPAWQYHKIWMQLRDQRCASGVYKASR